MPSSGCPSVWYDEAATVVSATRTWGQLWAMIHTVDLVHAAYYAFMHLWFDVFPYSPTSLRVPSALATGVAAGLTVSLTRILVDRRTAVVAGLLFVLLPRVTWMGGEGRSYALSALFAVALTLVLVVAARRTAEDGHARTRRSITLWWVGYAVLAVVACAFFLYIALLVVGHALTMLVRVLRDRRDHAAERAAVDEWARTGAVAVVPASGAARPCGRRAGRCSAGSPGPGSPASPACRWPGSSPRRTARSAGSNDRASARSAACS